MELAALLAELGNALGIDDLGLDADGQCALLFDGEHTITFTPDSEDHSLILHSEVGKLSPQDDALCRTLLEASLLGAQTGGAAFAIHPELDAIILWKRHDAQFADMNSLQQALQAFLAQIIHWKQRLARQEPAPSSGSTTDAGLPSFGLMV